MKRNDIDAMYKVAHIMAVNFDIPRSWLDASPVQRSQWFFRRLLGLIVAMPFMLVLCVVAGVVSVLAHFGHYLHLWCELLVGPDPEPIDYQI